MPEATTLFLTSPHYLESLLADEVRALGKDSAVRVRESQGGVWIEGKNQLIYRLCLWSRLASRVLLQLQEGAVSASQELYSLTAAVPWYDHFGPTATLAVDSHVSHPAFSRPDYANLVVKDAIVDSVRKTTGKRPSIDVESPDARVFLYLTTKEARIYLDMSGESLHKRGYRQKRTEAPLRENGAAAVLARAGWNAAVEEWLSGDAPPPFFADPLCGSGTLPIEATLIATATAPGLLRHSFGFERWKKCDFATWQSIREEAVSRSRETTERWKRAGGRIWASDRDPHAVETARENARRAGVEDHIDFGTIDVRKLTRGALLGRLSKSFGSEPTRRYFLATNPPYGVRLAQTGDPEAIFRDLGRWMSETVPGFVATVLSGSKEQAKSIGLRAQRVNVLYNGNIKASLAIIRVGPDNRYSATDRQAEGASSQPSSDGVAMVRNRILKNQKRLTEYLESGGVGCYRVYDADIPQYAAAVDVYNDTKSRRWGVIQEYAPPKTVDPQAAALRLRETVSAVSEALQLDDERLILKERRRQRGSEQYRRQGEGYNGPVVVPECGLLFEVRLAGYIDTGLFLDGRKIRWKIENLLSSRSENAPPRFLNLFAYTCSASLYAARAGAETWSVDTSATYLHWGRRNFGLNGVSTTAHQFVRQDALSFLSTTRQTFDLVLLDPPTFSNSKSRDTDFEVQRDHPHLLELAARHLSPGGHIVFSTNYRRFALADDLSSRFSVTDASEETLPPDFARKANFRRTWILSSKDE